jgi:lipopolysaccharide/colanic/teichoic acid biosynthesis glycosyltransferase
MSDRIKRAIDVMAAIVGLLFLWPVLLVCAVGVRLSSPGPVLYRGIRTGLHGKPFRILKFRSMVVDAEQAGGTTTAARDPRITPVGAVLRKYKLDELPQLFNVLQGDMSVVGPRPEVAEYTDAYTGEERLILSVRPGITDLSSLQFHDLQAIVGSRDADATFRREVLPRKNALRLQYVQEKSLWLDGVILLRTICVVCGKPFRKKTTTHDRVNQAT